MDCDVLIVGAGPVGLSLAIELGGRGVRAIVVERNDRVGYSPRAKMTNVRSREHLRRWGVARALERASPMAPGHPAHVVFATRMNGPLLARFEHAWNCAPERNDLYAESGQWVPQYTLEEVLRVHAASLPSVEVRFNTALETFTQDADGVVADLRDVASGASGRLRARYVAGADGARSAVRKLIDARLLGDGVAPANLNVVFRSQRLAGAHVHGPAAMYWMVNADAPSLLGPLSDDGLWYFIATKIDAEVPAADLCDLIRRATGLDIDVEILSVDPWIARRLIADRYSAGRAFLVGDACHLHPPFGGYGMNTGIGDAVDLGWKLAATIAGWGGAALLASYEVERRPIHEWAMSEALANYETVSNQLVRPGVEAPGALGDATRREAGEMIAASKIREMRTLGVVKGQRYAASPIIVDDGSAPPIRHSMIYEPSAHPGCVAPHLWLADGSSLYDHFGAGFTLLVTEGAHDEAVARLRAAAAAVNAPLAMIRPADARLRARYGAALALIRPDQHVAWRGDAAPADAAALLDHVRGAATAGSAVMAERSFDHIIVGAGSAGCVLAGRLSENPGVRVLLLEAGGWDRDPLITIPLAWGRLYTKKLHDWRYATEPEPALGGRAIECARGKVIGGSSSTNAMAYVRGHAADYDRWAASGLPTWSYAHALPYLRKQESWEGGADAYRGADGPLTTRVSTFEDPLVDGIAASGREAGFGWSDDYNGAQQEGFARVQQTIRDGRRCSASVAYLRPALSRPNLSVLTRAQTSRVTFEGARAVGVEYERGGERHSARAPSVILACGVIATPQLLNLSGVGDPDDLRRLGVTPRVALRGVGRNLRDHLSPILRFARRDPGPVHRRMRFDRVAADMVRAYVSGTGPASDMPGGLFGFLKTNPSQPIPDMQFIVNAAPLTAKPYVHPALDGYDDGFAFRLVLLRPQSVGRVSLRSADPRVAPIIQQNFLSAGQDGATLRAAVRVGLDIARRKPLAPFLGAALNAPADASDAALDAFIRANALTTHHPLGTCRMGRPDDAMAVVDEELRVLGADGLRVVDASVMPDMIGGNINAAVIMIAERAADLIAGRAPLAPQRIVTPPSTLMI